MGFVYDADGRRVRQTGGPPNTAKAFLFDGDTAIGERGDNGWIFRTPGVGDLVDGSQYYERENAQGTILSTVGPSGALGNRNYYDGYGKIYPLGSGGRSRYGYAGGHGYAEDGASGMLLCGARFYIPGIGRFLTPDPIGHEGGLNLYAYCDNNPVNAVDPTGHQGYAQNAEKSWFAKHIAIPTLGWLGALDKTRGWMLGTGADHMNYGPNSLEVYQMRNSDIGFFIDSAIIDSAYMSRGPKTITNQSSGSFRPFLSTIFQPTNGTQAFIGGYTWSASRYGNTISVRVHNETTMKSAFYHWLGVSDWRGWDRSSNGFGPMGSTYQDYRWTIPVPNFWRNK